MGPFLAEDDGLIWLSFFLEVSRPLCFCQGFVHPGGFVLRIPTSYISLLCEFVYWSRNGFSNTSGPLIKDLIGSLPSLLGNLQFLVQTPMRKLLWSGSAPPPPSPSTIPAPSRTQLNWLELFHPAYYQFPSLQWASA